MVKNRILMKDKNVLITGATGSLGYALTEKFIAQGANLTLFSRDEKKQYDMKKIYPDCKYIVGDVRNYHSIRDAVRGMDIVVHAASLKYVNISELQPYEYTTVNVDGTINLVNAILEEGTVERCVGISTDKACLPVNAYGLTKALLEKIMLEANSRQGGNTIFNVARYGNVIGTRGSVIPFWKERREQGLSLPITNPDMTRFFFTLGEAVELIEYCLQAPAGVIVSKAMGGVTLRQLAEVMQGDCEIELVGERPGEKHHEMLLSEDEIKKSYKDSGMWIFNPQDLPKDNEEFPSGYSSQNAYRMSNDEIASMIGEFI